MATNWNQSIIDEFRANEGRVGGRFEGSTLLLLHHTGARSGIERVNPLGCQALDGGGWAVFGSRGGAPSNPDWFYNLKANPRARIEVGTETHDVIARVAEGEERERIWTRQKERIPAFAEYERNTERVIPVMILEPVDDAAGAARSA